MPQRRLEQLVFTFMVGALFLGAALLALQFPDTARRFPLTAALVSLSLVVVQLIRMVWRRGKSQVSQADKQPSESQETLIGQAKKIFPYLLWILGFYSLIFVFGFVIASGVFVVAFLFTQAKMRPLVALLAGGLVVGFILLIGDVLSLEWPFGLISDWFGIEL